VIEATAGIVEVEGAQLWYEVAGAGPWLVMLHGHLLDSGQWDDQFASFADGYRVVRYDARGFGRSSDPAGPFSYSEDLFGLMRALGIDRAFLMGCSGGGSTIVDFALAHPDMTRALVLVGSGVAGFRYTGAPLPEMTAFQEARERGDVDAAVELGLRISTDGARSAEQVDARARERTREMMTRLFRRGNPAVDVRRVEPPAASRLAELRVPVLAIVGDQDLAALHDIADLVAAEAPAGRKVVMADAGHHPNMEHPAEFDELVRTFLAHLG
jgi:pimeloyl-ACP methyl ester carboxylesterase